MKPSIDNKHKYSINNTYKGIHIKQHEKDTTYLQKHKQKSTGNLPKQINRLKQCDNIRNTIISYLNPEERLFKSHQHGRSQNNKAHHANKKMSRQSEKQKVQPLLEKLVKMIVEQVQEEPLMASVSQQQKQKQIKQLSDPLIKNCKQKDNNASRQTLEKLISILQNKKERDYQADQQKEYIRRSLKHKQNKIQELERKQIPSRDEDREFERFFCVNILSDEECEQEYLYNVAKKYCGRVRSTRLIYIWDKLHKTNIHEYIDNKPNLMFLILTEGGSRLAAFTEASFKKPYPDIGFGAIVSLSNRKVFTVRPNQRAISYDGTYVIFGKNELLIKGNEVSSNLGNAGGYYESRGERAQILFNEGSKSNTTIAELQIYQIEN